MTEGIIRKTLISLVPSPTGYFILEVYGVYEHTAAHHQRVIKEALTSSIFIHLRHPQVRGYFR